MRRLKLPRIRLNLSTRLILAMAAVVAITTLACFVIFNIIITNQTQEIQQRVQRAFVSSQDNRRPTQPPTEVVAQVKTILDNSDLSPEAQLVQVSQALRNGGAFGPQAFYKILRDSGLPATLPYNGQDGAGAPPPPDPNHLPKFGTVIQQSEEKILISPVAQSFMLGSLLAALFAVAMGFIISRTVIKPLRALEKASERIADGNYTLQLGPEGNDDLGRLARSFNRMAEALRLTEQKRKELVSNVAHELRTPLSSIQGYTEVLRDGLVPSRHRQEEMFDHILGEVRYLTKMVESMRVWMSNEQALEHLNVEEVPAKLAARLVIERFQPTAGQREVELNLEVPTAAENVKVQADGDALSHILGNLVDNALRYTGAGGEVKIKINPTNLLPGSKKNVVWFEVSDTGVGIPAEHLPFIFERFYRVDKSRDRHTGGTGLGLAIVRDTIQALGGEVKIESQVGQGTTIKFWLPQVVTTTANRRQLALLPS